MSSKTEFSLADLREIAESLSDVCVHVADETSSTMQLARQLPFPSTCRAAHEFGASCLFIARSQNAGRGRGGNQWSSPPGSGLFLTLRVSASPTPIATLPIEVGAAIHTALQQFEIPSAMKFPNDILVRDDSSPNPVWRKLGGILCESYRLENRPFWSVGFGMNVFPTPSTTSVGGCALHEIPSCIGREQQICKQVLNAIYRVASAPLGDLNQILARL